MISLNIISLALY